MKNLLTVCLILGISLFMQSCSNKLDRNKAKEVLNGYYHLPRYVEAKQLMSTYSYRGMFLFYQDYNMAPLIQANLINHQHYISRGTIYDITTPTALTKQYIDSGGYEQNSLMLRLADVELGDITEIFQEEKSKTATVTFTLKYSNCTPFGKARNYFRPDDYNTEKRKALFMLTDNGWTVQQAEQHDFIYCHNAY